ncbi:MAG: ATP-dependent zinc protease [Elainellaceae cyanobacterium]
MTSSTRSPHPLIGWREWLTLPELGISSIKAKIDTGARTSSLYAFNIEPFDRDGVHHVRFKVHPSQHDETETIESEAPLLDQRQVKNSGGKAELRPVILTPVSLNGQLWPIELTLTHRRGMQFRMLLGREAVRKRFLVDPGRSYLQSSRPVSSAPSHPPTDR